MSSARLGSPLTLKLPMLTSMILPSLSFSSTPLALCAEIKTLCPASIHPPVRIIMSTSNAVTSNSTGDCSAPLATRTPFPWIRGGAIMRLLLSNFARRRQTGLVNFRSELVQARPRQLADEGSGEAARDTARATRECPDPATPRRAMVFPASRRGAMSPSSDSTQSHGARPRRLGGREATRPRRTRPPTGSCPDRQAKAPWFRDTVERGIV
jgi:hypothetical protein